MDLQRPIGKWGKRGREREKGEREEIQISRVLFVKEQLLIDVF